MSNFLEINGVVLHYQYIRREQRVQCPKTFLFINALGTDFRIWWDVATTLIKYGDVVLFDKRGHGLSGTPSPKTNLALSDLADDANAILDTLSIEKCFAIGLDVGGMIAQILASRHPSRIEALILCDTSYKMGNVQSWNQRIKAVRGHGFSSISGGEMRRWFAESFRRKNPNAVSGYCNMLERTSKTGYIQTCEAIRDADLKEVIGQMNVPVLSVVGSEDVLTPPDQVKELSELIENSVFTIIPDSGHIPCVDNSTALSSKILDFTSKQVQNIL